MPYWEFWSLEPINSFEVLSDPELKRTKEELAIALSNFVEARKKVFEFLSSGVEDEKQTIARVGEDLVCRLFFAVAKRANFGVRVDVSIVWVGQ